MKAQDAAYDKISQIIAEQLQKALGETIQKIVEIGNGAAIKIEGLEGDDLQLICKGFVNNFASIDINIEINPLSTVTKRQRELLPLILLPSGMKSGSTEILAPSRGLKVKLVY